MKKLNAADRAWITRRQNKIELKARADKAWIVRKAKSSVNRR